MTPADIATVPNDPAAPLAGTTGVAEALAAEVAVAVERLLALIEEETRLIRRGALFAASDLQAEKSRLSADYVKLRFRLRDNAAAVSRLPPEQLQALTRMHETFAENLKVNMAVLATAREVAEDIVRNVANAVGRLRAPQTYSPGSQLQSASRTAARGISVDKKL